MPTTTPCLRSAQEGLPGERDSASEVKCAPRSGHFQGHFPQWDEGDKHGLCFWHVCLVLDELEPNNQNWFGENCLLSLYMGLNHPQKLFLMPGRCSKTIWENTSFGWNFGSWAFGLGWCLSSSQKKYTTTVIWKRNKWQHIIKMNLLRWQVHFFFFSFYFFLKINVCVWQMMLWFHLFEL